MPLVLSLLAASAQIALVLWLATIAAAEPLRPPPELVAFALLLALPHLLLVRLAGRYAGRRHPGRDCCWP